MIRDVCEDSSFDWLGMVSVPALYCRQINDALSIIV